MMAPRVMTQMMAPTTMMAPRVMTAPIATQMAPVSAGVRVATGSSNLLAMGTVVSERVITLDELAAQGRFGVMTPDGAVDAPQTHNALIVEQQLEGAEQANPVFDELWPYFEEKMRAGGPESSSDAAVQAFQYNYHVLTSGADTMIPESSLDAVPELPALVDLQIDAMPELLRETVI